MWAERKCILQWLIKDKDWKKYSFNALCKVDQIQEALNIYCDNAGNYSPTGTHQLADSLKKLINRTNCRVFGIYIGLNDVGNWYGFKDKKFFFLFCDSCGVAWN